jgi:hypothetical protein
MPQSTQFTPIRPANYNGATRPKSRHYVRMFFASVFGSLALSLIFASILVVWLNRTLTDTNTYVRTVAPLASSPDIQNFIALTASDAIVKNAPPLEAAAVLLPPAEITGKTPEQLQLAIKTVVSDTVVQIVRSQHFQTLWQDTNRTAQADLIKQIKGGSSELSLDLSPLVTGVVDELKTTKFAIISDKIILPEGVGKINLTGGVVSKAHDYYQMFQAATIAIVGVTLLAMVLCVVISVEHIRTMRRILVGTGIISLISAALLGAPSLIGDLNGIDPIQQRAAVALASALFHDLRLSLIIIGVTCVVLAVVSKIVSKYRSRVRV